MNGIKRLRRLCNVTQQEFAEIVGVNEGTVERWESGRNKPYGPLSIVRLEKLGAPYGMKYNDIMRKG